MDSEIEREESMNNTTDEMVLIKKSELEALKSKAGERDQLYEKYLRLRAEFDNYKKFIERQKVDYLKYGNKRLLSEIIKIYEDFKRAVREIKDSQTRQGLNMILNNFSALLKNEGVIPIEAEGTEFNPDLHECLLVDYDPSLPEGYVTEVLEDGYYLNGKVLRPSKVKINKNNRN
ncbi:MAG: nucleotide exchange factor GrpE [Candidatus Helarchaeota archaeon]